MSADGFVPLRWREALHGVPVAMSRAARTALRRRTGAARRRFHLLVAMTVVSTLLGTAMFVWMGVVRAVSRADAENALSQTSRDNGRADDNMVAMLAKARAYNARLAETPQIIGEAVLAGGMTVGDFTFDEDAEYQDALDMGDGIMAALSIPKIGLRLPIRHGAGEYALANGLGHLHGTSLPVGGASTHAAITGHRGLADKELFTRLDELAVGDPFYIELGDGGTLGYQVERILETNPDQTDRLRIEPGRDLVTLVTCTPIMLNTRRLLITGMRARMPDIVPPPESAPGDDHPKETTVSAAAACLMTGWSAVGMLERRGRWWQTVHPRHMTTGERSCDG